MKLLLVFLILCQIQDSEFQTQHVAILLSGCSDSDAETVAELDGDELVHSNFINRTVVKTLPDFADPIQLPDEYEYTVKELNNCKYFLAHAAEAYKNPPEALDVPQTFIYPRDDVQLGSANTLICHSTRFFPPPVQIRWTKNGVDLTDTAPLSRYLPNPDRTYNQFSHLSFTPEEGDIYTCTVEHKALQLPDTKTWEVDVELPSVAPSVLCGVGLLVGLFGLMTGTFFFIRGFQFN